MNFLLAWRKQLTFKKQFNVKSLYAFVCFILFQCLAICHWSKIILFKIKSSQICADPTNQNRAFFISRFIWCSILFSSLSVPRICNLTTKFLDMLWGNLLKLSENRGLISSQSLPLNKDPIKKKLHIHMWQPVNYASYTFIKHTVLKLISTYFDIGIIHYEFTLWHTIHFMLQPVWRRVSCYNHVWRRVSARNA